MERCYKAKTSQRRFSSTSAQVSSTTHQPEAGKSLRATPLLASCPQPTRVPGTPHPHPAAGLAPITRATPARTRRFTPPLLPHPDKGQQQQDSGHPQRSRSTRPATNASGKYGEGGGRGTGPHGTVRERSHARDARGPHDAGLSPATLPHARYPSCLPPLRSAQTKSPGACKALGKQGRPTA